MKNLFTNSLAATLLVFVGLGCGRLDSIPGTNYFESDIAQKAAAAVKEKIGKPFNVAEVFIDEDEFRIHAQDPNNPRNLDEYKYVAGFVTGPNPVKLDGMKENLEKSSFPFDKINFAAIPELARQAVEKAGIEGAQIYAMTFQRGFAVTNSGMGSLGEAYWKIEIRGTRENVSATADPQGKLLGVDLSGTSRALDYKITTGEELQKAHDALKDFFGEKARISGITISENSLTLKVVNSQNPGGLDSYQYGINGLAKYGVMPFPNVNHIFYEYFSIGDIKLTDAPRFIEKAKQRVAMPNAVLNYVSIRREKSSLNNKGSRFIWSVNLKQEMNEGSVDYDNDGNEILVRKNGETVFRKK